MSGAPILTEAGRANRLRRAVLGLLTSEHLVLIVALCYFAVLLPFIPWMASPRNLANVLSNMWPLLAIAVGQMVVLIVGGIDLSQTSTMALASVAGALLMSTQLDPILFSKSPLWGDLIGAGGGPLSGQIAAVPLAVLVMLATGATIGLMNGISVARFNMPPFMVTLVSMMFFSALAIFLTKSENVVHLPAGFTALGQGGLGVLPYSLMVAVTVALGAHMLLRKTVMGRWLYAVGRNPRAALVSGVPTARVIVFAYVFSGICAAVGAVLYTARLEAGRPTLGQNLLLDIVGATVIGGTSLFGGRGKVLWTLYGVFFFALLSNSLNLLNLSFYTVNIVKGGVILLAALSDVVRSRKEGRQ